MVICLATTGPYASLSALWLGRGKGTTKGGFCRAAHDYCGTINSFVISATSNIHMSSPGEDKSCGLGVSVPASCYSW